MHCTLPRRPSRSARLAMTCSESPRIIRLDQFPAYIQPRRLRVSYHRRFAGSGNSSQVDAGQQFGGGVERRHLRVSLQLPMVVVRMPLHRQLPITPLLAQNPASWAAIEMSREYGRDLLVTVPAAPGLVGGDDFWVQMKGSEAPN